MYDYDCSYIILFGRLSAPVNRLNTIYAARTLPSRQDLQAPHRSDEGHYAILLCDLQIETTWYGQGGIRTFVGPKKLYISYRPNAVMK